jgi:hypothetical protein
MEDNQSQTQEVDLTKLSKDELKAVGLELMKKQIQVFKAETKKIVDVPEEEIIKGKISNLSQEMIKEFNDIQKVIDLVAKEYKKREKEESNEM